MQYKYNLYNTNKISTIKIKKIYITNDIYTMQMENCGIQMKFLQCKWKVIEYKSKLFNTNGTL